MKLNKCRLHVQLTASLSVHCHSSVLYIYYDPPPHPSLSFKLISFTSLTTTSFRVIQGLPVCLSVWLPQLPKVNTISPSFCHNVDVSCFAPFHCRPFLATQNRLPLNFTPDLIILISDSDQYSAECNSLLKTEKE